MNNLIKQCKYCSNYDIHNRFCPKQWCQMYPWENCNKFTRKKTQVNINNKKNKIKKHNHKHFTLHTQKKQ